MDQRFLQTHCYNYKAKSIRIEQSQVDFQSEQNSLLAEFRCVFIPAFIRCFIYACALLYGFYLLLRAWQVEMPTTLLAMPLVASVMPATSMWLSYVLRRPRLVVIDSRGFKDARYFGEFYIYWWFVRSVKLERNPDNPEQFKIILKMWLGDSIHMFDKGYSEVVEALQVHGKL